MLPQMRQIQRFEDEAQTEQAGSDRAVEVEVESEEGRG